MVRRLFFWKSSRQTTLVKGKSYSICSRNNPSAGTEKPASDRSFDSIIRLKSSTLSFPDPISSKVPTIARTILRKKRSAVIVNINCSFTSGCGYRCIKGNAPCRGCYGPTPDVIDPGAKMMSAIATAIDSDDPEEIERIVDSIVDPAGTFYRTSVPSALFRKKIVEEHMEV